ncbi:MAG: CPBP family intramembrane metalloprotease [Phycisphaerales bacterium]|nr:CPBP family intramembrane metalloprotease [Phycisphaerales bacterium]
MLAVAIVGHAAAALLYAVLLPDTSVRRAVYFGSKLVINALPVVWVFAIERRRMRFLRPSANAIVSGVCTGLVIGGAILLFYHSAIAGRLDATGLRARVGAYGMLDHFFLFAAFICVANSGMEEYYWRWFVFAGLKREMDWPWAVVVSAAGFTLHHIVVLAAYFSGAGLIVLCNLGVFVGGCIWAAQYHRTGSIYATWASHLIADAAIMVVAYDLLIGPVVP